MPHPNLQVSGPDAAAPSPQLTVGVVGIGQMGLAVALRLRDCGHALRVHDVSADRCALARQENLTLCSSAADAAQGCAVLVVAVVDAAQTAEVLFGAGGAGGADGTEGAERDRGVGGTEGTERDSGVGGAGGAGGTGGTGGAGGAGGAAAALAPGSAVLLCPTMAPADTEALARRLHAMGLQAIDAPMSGGPQRARQGRMSLMVACADEVWTRWQPLLHQMANPVFHVGRAAGAGARTKLVNNLLAAINLAGASEALALAEKLGLDAATTLRVIEASSGQSWIGSDRLQRALATANLADRAPLAQTALLAKDSTLALQAARQAGAKPLLGALAQQVFAQVCAAGMSTADDSALLDWMRRRGLGDA